MVGGRDRSESCLKSCHKILQKNHEVGLRNAVKHNAAVEPHFLNEQENLRDAPANEAIQVSQERPHHLGAETNEETERML